MSNARELVAAERKRQNEKWGYQDHSDGTGPNTLPLYDEREYMDDSMTAKQLADRFTARTDKRFAGESYKPGTWLDILLEEIFEASAEEPESEKLITELVQSAAVLDAWINVKLRHRGEYTE